MLLQRGDVLSGGVQLRIPRYMFPITTALCESSVLSTTEREIMLAGGVFRCMMFPPDLIVLNSRFAQYWTDYYNTDPERQKRIEQVIGNCSLEIYKQAQLWDEGAQNVNLPVGQLSSWQPWQGSGPPWPTVLDVEIRAVNYAVKLEE